MTLGEFEHILRRAIGLDAGSIGMAAFERAVRGRVAACKAQNLRAYAEHLEKTPGELQELIEAVVVPETWFFRDREAFSAMIRMVRDGWLPEHRTGVLRLLSLPCSTGEEPASIAMALLDAGVPAERFRIDAVDVSGRAIAYAQRGVYGKNSFRGSDLTFRRRYFASKPDGHHLAEAVLERVTFMRANLFDPGFLPEEQIYDIVFCRNMLIYFDDEARKTAVGLLQRLMKADGRLFVGPSETSLLIDHDFVSAKIPLAFALRKASTAKPEPVVAIEPAPPRMTPARARPARTSSAPVPQVVGNLALKLEDISRIADQGQLAEAATACEALLRAGDPSPDAFHLLGLIHDAAGNLADATKCYRKSLYLDPNHRDTLVHLALLLEKQSDKAGAKKLTDRVRRLDRREGK